VKQAQSYLAFMWLNVASCLCLYPCNMWMISIIVSGAWLWQCRSCWLELGFKEL